MLLPIVKQDNHSIDVLFFFFLAEYSINVIDGRQWNLQMVGNNETNLISPWKYPHFPWNLSVSPTIIIFVLLGKCDTINGKSDTIMQKQNSTVREVSKVVVLDFLSFGFFQL